MKDPSLELVLPEHAELASVSGDMLAPQVLPQLWPQTGAVFVKDVKEYFSGAKVVQVSKGGFEEPLSVPKASPEVVLEGIRAAVQSGSVWLVAGQASIWKESVPAGVLNDTAELHAPPSPILVTDILADALPDAWEHGATTAISVLNACSTKMARPQPWPLVKDAIDSAIRGHYLERAEDSGPWPCDLAAASSVKLGGVSRTIPTGDGPTSPQSQARPGVLRASAKLSTDQIQDLADQIGEIKKAAAGAGLEIQVTIEIGVESPTTEEARTKVQALLQTVSEQLSLE